MCSSQFFSVNGGGDAHAGEAGADFFVWLALAVEDVGEMVRVASDQSRNVCDPAASQARRHLDLRFLVRLPRLHLFSLPLENCAK